MTLSIRDVQPHDLDSVLALNNAAGSTILPLDAAGLHSLYEQASYFRLAEVEGHVAAFLLALREDADYASANYRWFREHYAQFVYIDRIVVAKPYRGLGLGRVLYADVTSYAEDPRAAAGVRGVPRTARRRFAVVPWAPGDSRKSASR